VRIEIERDVGFDRCRADGLAPNIMKRRVAAAENKAPQKRSGR